LDAPGHVGPRPHPRRALHPRLNENRTRLLARLAAAALAAGRDPQDIELVAVTKSVPAETAMELFDLGCQDLAENRADALLDKHAAFLATGRVARWHFIGHLQRNKARRVLSVAHAIHSVDSLELHDTLARIAREEQRAPGIYLQLKLADETAKGGLDPAGLPDLLARAVGGPLPLLGLMTMAPLHSEPARARADARAVFERLAALATTLSPSVFVGGRVRLSMGMSQDFEEAVRAGATTVRIGSQLFEGTGERRSA
ncbi:MAG: YggS family pyridoxal phosphate-dependent enzyme, partial [Planctomycetota bacterium]